MSQSKNETAPSVDVEKQVGKHSNGRQDDDTIETASIEPTSQEVQEPPREVLEPIGPPYTTFSEKDKIFTVIIASFAALISPISASIYYPALNPLAADLHVQVSTINLTITVYMVSSSQTTFDIMEMRISNGLLDIRSFKDWRQHS